MKGKAADSMRRREAKLSHARLLELLSYEPDTGAFLRLRRAGRFKAGDVAGCKRERYIFIGIDGDFYRAHRLAWFYVTGSWPADEIDHRDTDETNNRWKNLRESSHGQNLHNRCTYAKSGLKGAYKQTNSENWMSRIMVQGQYVYLGTFPSAEEANAAYYAAAQKHHGQFARKE